MKRLHKTSKPTFPADVRHARTGMHLRWWTLALLLAGAGLATSAAAADAAADAGAVRDQSVVQPRLQVGDATSQLLALQRGGSVASTTPRPIAGDVATRSYQRYLQSFDHPIPERFGPTVGATTSGGATAGAR